MTNSELIELLKKSPADAEVWMPVWNKYVNTYVIVDDVYKTMYVQIQNDFYGTPGRMDKRLFNCCNEHKDESPILLLSSKFSEIPNPDVDFGNDFIDYDIKTINGPDGDEDLLWHMNKFEYDKERNTYYKTIIGDCSAILHHISYIKDAQMLIVDNYELDKHYKGRETGIESIRKIIEMLKVPITLWT